MRDGESIYHYMVAHQTHVALPLQTSELFTPPRTYQSLASFESLRDQLQICDTGVSQDFINPFFAAILPLGSPDMPWPMRYAAVSRAIAQIPDSYASHLESRYTSLRLVVPIEVQEHILALAGTRIESLNSQIEQIKRLPEHNWPSFFLADLPALLHQVQVVGRLIFGELEWRYRGSESVLDALPTK